LKVNKLMDTDFWKQRWQRRETGFHRPEPHEQLRRNWPALNLPHGSTVLVPLAGKSRDMAWLAEQGHRIIGVELSEIAIGEFFSDAGLTPQKRHDGQFEVYSAGPFTLYCGDFFDLPAAALLDVSAVYDRAALVALPKAARERYAAALTGNLPHRAVIFLIALDYPEHEISGPPFCVSRGEVGRLYGEAFEIEVLEARDGLAASQNLINRGVTRLEEATYLLRRRA
jgi:thiopurine S-methyltransferase